MMTGTLLNAAAILLGSAIGLAIKWGSTYCGSRFSPTVTVRNQRIQQTIMQGIALCVLSIGIKGCLAGQHSLVPILSIVLGGFLGEWMDLERRMQKLGSWVQKKSERFLTQDSSPSVAEGFVTTTLLFCVGAMSIVGALENGLSGSTDTLQVKSLLDFISSIIFSSSLGIGVILSAIPVLIYQGTISLLASVLSPLLSPDIIAEISCTGSLLIIGLALNLLGVAKIKVMNLVPGIFLPILFCPFFSS